MTITWRSHTIEKIIFRLADDFAFQFFCLQTGSTTNKTGNDKNGKKYFFHGFSKYIDRWNSRDSLLNRDWPQAEFRILSPELRKPPMKTISAIPLLMLVGILALAGCGLQESDEAKLRHEFVIPPAARVVSYKATPDKAGWFGREGLKIDIVFQVDPQDYAAYAASAEASEQWLPLPIPDSFLRRMGAIASAKDGIVRSYRLQGRPLPAEGSVYNPTVERLQAAFLASLPPQPARGLFQCRSAGTDIMNARKTVHTQLDRDLNDFMLALLDHDRRQIAIKVSTRY